MEVKEKLTKTEIIMQSSISILNTEGEKQPQPLTEAEVLLIKQTLAQGATAAELERLLYLANTYGLNPLKNELWFIKQPAMQRINGQWVYKRLEDGSLSYEGSHALLMTSRDGYLKIAQTYADFQGLISFEVREGDHFSIDAANYHIEHRYGAQRGRLLGAWARCERQGMAPVITYANYEEYHRPGNYAWTQFPSAMIRKVAEVMALKRAFAINGLATKEEMGYKGPYSQDRQQPQYSASEAIHKAMTELRQLRTLYQLNKYVQALPGEVKNDRQFVVMVQERRRHLVETEKNRPATAKQLETLGSMALNRCISDSERSSILQHMHQYSYYTASMQIKSLSDCIRNRSMRRTAA